MILIYHIIQFKSKENFYKLFRNLVADCKEVYLLKFDQLYKIIRAVVATIQTPEHLRSEVKVFVAINVNLPIILANPHLQTEP